MARLIADAGLLIAADRNDREAWALKRVAAEESTDILIPSPVLAQVWRGPGSENLARFLKGLVVLPFDEAAARRAGNLLGVCETRDVIDAAVVVSAADGDRIVTGDPKDISLLLERSGTRATIQQV